MTASGCAANKKPGSSHHGASGRTDCGRYTFHVHRLSRLVAILLLLIAAAPVFACVAETAMTHEESVCCHSLHRECGETAKMECCRTETDARVAPQLVASAPELRLALLFVAWMVPPVTPLPGADLALWRSPAEHSPPGLIVARVTVLRI